MPPYELYAEILGAEGGRRALLERLGTEAEDPVEEFLGLALAYEREHVPSLQGFLRWLVAGDTEVKRDFGARQRDEVRILTVHGAKGLEAPVVFLPDTMQLPNQPDTLLWTERDELPLWCPRRDLAVPFYAAEKRGAACAPAAGIPPPALRRPDPGAGPALYLRLADAGRAQGRLAGIRSAAPVWPRSRRRLPSTATPLIGADGWCGEGLRLTGAQTAAPVRERPAAAVPAGRSLPKWVRDAAAGRARAAAARLPRRGRARTEPPALSPLAAAGRDRFKRGLLVHRLLQSLPELPVAERDDAARGFWRCRRMASPLDEQDDIRRETLAVLEPPRFRRRCLVRVRRPRCRSSGLPSGGHAVSAQIDRLVVDGGPGADRRLQDLAPAARHEDEVAPLYLRQLAIYRAALAQIYPGREIRCALLWTEGPRLMPISPEILAGYLP